MRRPAGFAGVNYPASITTTAVRQLPESSNCRSPDAQSKPYGVARIRWPFALAHLAICLPEKRCGSIFEAPVHLGQMPNWKSWIDGSPFQ
jgi:hypothetical protein